MKSGSSEERVSASVAKEESKCESGNLGACSRLEKRYESGNNGVAKDPDRAAYYREKGREEAYLDFVNSHPEMKDPAFEKDVANLVRSRAAAGDPIYTEDTYEIVKALQQKQAQIEKQPATSTESTTTERESPMISTAPQRVKAGDQKPNKQLDWADVDLEEPADWADVVGKMGYFSIDSDKPANIYVDDRKVGVTPVVKTEVTPGGHRVLAVEVETGKRKALTASVQRGEERRIQFIFSPVQR